MPNVRTGLMLSGALLLAACQPVETAPEAPRGERVGTIVFHPCTLDGGRTGQTVEAQCARLVVPEDRAQPDGRTIALNIARLAPEKGQAGLPDPVFFLAGGPGQSATELAGPILAGLRKVNKTRDIYLMDQRGTGQSNPLDCRGVDGKPLPVETAVDGVDGLVLQAGKCLDSLAGRADPRFYTTTDAVADLEALRLALMADQVNLVGGSYGTRVGQQYAARHPGQTRTLVLDGLVPNDLVVGAEFAQTFQRALEAQSSLCRADAACAARFPVDTPTQLAQVVDALKVQPRPVQFRDPATAVVLDETLKADDVTGLAFAFSYVPEMSALLPVVLDEAVQGRYAGLAALARLASQSMSGQINRGLQLSVICSEDDHRQTDEAQAATGTLMGPELSQMFYAACRIWPRGKVPADFTAPLATAVPALLLSGELDPVTPPSYAERVKAHLPGARHLVARGRGHGTLSAGCMPTLLAQFIETADAHALDATCLDALRPVPPFTTFNGWEP